MGRYVIEASMYTKIIRTKTCLLIENVLSFGVKYRTNIISTFTTTF